MLRLVCSEVSPPFSQMKLMLDRARTTIAVGKHAAAPLLFAVRRGVLDEEFVRRVGKTPRKLVVMAVALGLETEFEEEVAAGS